MAFAITLVLRYILEFCQNSAQAVEVLKSVPVHMAYNITLLDRQGVSKTVAICPGEDIQVSSLAFATNHQQGTVIEDIDVIADSYAREQFIATRLADPRQQSHSLVKLFLEPPILRKASDWQQWGTLYTARYLPSSGTVELHWPNGQVVRQSFEHFIEGSVSVSSPAYL
jgi:predicted choloylglycine hydrolase